MDKNRYSKISNATSRGMEHQINLLTIVLFKGIQKLENWRLSADNESAGKFDDVVFESPQGDILIQSVFEETSQIVLEELLSENPSYSFSLVKYFLSYVKIKEKFNVKNVIICTNTCADDESLEFMNVHKVPREALLYYKDGTEFYTFQEEILPHLKSAVEKYFQRRPADKTVITDEKLKSFITHLQLYCNYSTVEDLDFTKTVDGWLRLLKRSMKHWGQISYGDIRDKVADWSQQKTGEYLTRFRARAMLWEILSDNHWKMFQHFNVDIDHLDCDESEQIIHVIPNGEGFLEEIQIYCTLRDFQIRALYINPNDAVSVQREVIQSFELPQYRHLVLVKPRVKEQTAELGLKLREILDKFRYKNVILLDGKLSEFSQQIASERLMQIENCITFKNFSEDTRKWLLEKKNIVFQGKMVSLLDIAGKYSSVSFEEALNLKMLEKLVRNEDVKVGAPLLDIDNHVVRNYIHRTFKREVSEDVFTEENICDLEENVIVITGSAGMGKTVVLTRLANVIKNKMPHLWVTIIPLNDYVFERIYSLNKMISIRELLDSKEVTKLRNEFEVFVFENLHKNVVLLFDGFDEVSPNYTDLILNLVVQCKEAANIAKVFVTSRPHLTEVLKEKFAAKPFLLQPFTVQDQVDFLTSDWMSSLDLGDVDRDKCQAYAKALIDSVACNAYQDNYVTAIPLQINIVAEVFRESGSRWQGCREYLTDSEFKPEVLKDIDFAELYETFIKVKRDIYIDKVNPGNATKNQALVDRVNENLFYHRTMALQFILDYEDCKRFSSYDEHVSRDTELTFLKLGILQKSNDKFKFIHPTFAEYFVAKSVLRELRNRHNVNFQKFFIDELLRKDKFSVIRTFFDHSLSKMVDQLPSDTFHEYQSTVDRVEFKSAHLLHQLAREGHTGTIQLVLKCIDLKGLKNQIVKIIEVTSKQDKRYGNTLKALQLLVQRDGLNIKDSEDMTPLHYAASEGHFHTLKFLISSGAHISIKNRFGNTALHEAIDKSHRTIVAYLLQHMLRDNKSDVADTTYAAAYLGQLDILKGLTEKIVDINTALIKQKNPLYAAIKGKRLNIVKHLLERGADVNAVDHYKRTALHKACRAEDIVKLLIEHGTNVNLADYYKRTALHEAATNGTLETVKLLVENGADVNAVDYYKRSALHEACKRGAADIVEFLVRCGTDVNLRDYYTRTALHEACTAGTLDTVKLLIESGTDVNVTDYYKRTALHEAVKRGTCDVVRLLVGHGTDVNLKDYYDRTALYEAATTGTLDIVELLVESGADVNVVEYYKRSALHEAAKRGACDIVRFLTEHGTNVQVSDYYGSTPLHEATAAKTSDTVKYLLQIGMDVNARDMYGRTALHLASAGKKWETAKLLVDTGADESIMNKLGLTPQQTADVEVEFQVNKFSVNYDLKYNLNYSLGHRSGKKMTGLKLSLIDRHKRTTSSKRKLEKIQKLSKDFLRKHDLTLAEADESTSDDSDSSSSEVPEAGGLKPRWRY